MFLTIKLYTQAELNYLQIELIICIKWILNRTKLRTYAELILFTLELFD